MSLTQEQLKLLVAYDPATGIFTRLVGGNQMKAGSVLGYEDHGYLRASIAGTRYYLHQLAFLYMEGHIPPKDIDHKDTNGLNNAWGNLRVAGKSLNGANRPMMITNTSGIKGVSFCATTKRWRASITVRGCSLNLGRYHSVEDAAEAYAKAAELHFGEFARTEAA